MSKGQKATFVAAHYAGGKEKVIAEAQERKSGGRVSENHSPHTANASKMTWGGKGVHGKPPMRKG